MPSNSGYFYVATSPQMLPSTRLRLVPESLLLLILHATATFAQSETLTLNESLSLNSTQLNSTTFALPQSSTSQLTVSVALCAAASSNDARFFVTNNTAVSDPGPDSTESDVYEVVVGDNGIGSVTLRVSGAGGVFAVHVGSAEQTFEVGVSDSASLHEVLKNLPLFGDSTANQALLFSPPFLAPISEEPSYPNYTLPVANLSSPTPPTTYPNFTLLVGPVAVFPDFNFTTNTFTDGTPVTACALEGRSNLTILSGSFGNVQESLVLRDADGWRFQWFIGGLQPLTNYTVFVVQDDVKVAGPINFVTKSASFACPLVHSLPYCPLVAYAVPLPLPNGPPGTAYDASSLPDSISGPLISYMSNFTTSLLTFACGRDWYSPVVGCMHCQEAYRTWLCSVQLPRCGDATSISKAASSSASGASSSQRRKRQDTAQATLATPALVTQNSSTGRNANLPAFPGGNWTELLPCLETCNAADRACPPFLGFACPVPRFNAGDSYGVGFIDGDTANPGGVWTAGGGTTGKAQDRWGHVWCNGPGLTV